MNNQISTIDLMDADVHLDPGFAEQVEAGDIVYVNLVKDADGQHFRANMITYQFPWMWNDPMIKGRVVWAENDENNQKRKVHIDYGIEQYFTPQGRVIEIERRADSNVDVQVRIGLGYEARVEKVFVDGKEFVR